MSTDYPSWICVKCGHKYGTWKEGHLATFHDDKCGWCGKKAFCTEPRDYGYPPAPEKKESRNASSLRRK